MDRLNPSLKVVCPPLFSLPSFHPPSPPSSPSPSRPREPVEDNQADGTDLEALGAHEDAKSEGAKHGHSVVINRVSTQSLTKRGMSSPFPVFLPFTRPLPRLPSPSRPREPGDDNKADDVDFEAPGASDVTKFNGGDKGFFSPLPIIKRSMSSALS